MTTVQDSNWVPSRYPAPSSPDRQYHVRRAPISTIYPYPHDPPAGLAMAVPIHYQYDPYYQQAQHQTQQWTHQPMPYHVPVEQAILHMPMNMYGPPSLPTSPIAWPQSPQCWPSGQAHQPKFSQTAPISPQHGPPRRPIQSRHALWVGNIPSQTPILALRDHFFIPEMADDILSVVFTPASNSGFINLRSAEACKVAMRRFNKSYLYGVPLNCRARKLSMGASSGTVESVGHATSLSKNTSGSSSSGNGYASDEHSLAKSHSIGDSSVASSDPDVNIEKEAAGVEELSSRLEEMVLPKGRNRYFIIKSLTYDDLLNSVKSRRWSTQVQNESLLNDAFIAGDFVCLIFSVNRSREYFGYARMTSQAECDAAPIVTSSPQDSSAKHLAQAKPPIVRTPITGHIPAGRIIDELCRGKIFWEIDVVNDSTSEVDENIDSAPREGLQKSFAIEWLSLKRIPFRQTTHLKNQLNENKEVKIARDGTELDADVGRRLCSLFHVPT